MTGTAGTGDPGEDREAARKRTVELVAVLLLSATTILTAWSAFEASKWGGAMSIAFSEASGARIESTRLDGTADSRQSNQVALWTQWVAATAGGDTALASFLVDRFPEPLATAHEDWLAAGGIAPGSPETPFELASFVLPERVAAHAESERAGTLFAVALRNNQRADNYTILTVLFAAVLFFTAMASRVTALRAQLVLLGTALVACGVGVVLLAMFPKLV